MKFAKYTYLIASIWGFLVLTPLYFMETQNGIDYPPPITHPEYYYGFIGLALVFQFLFFVISRDPLYYRKIMPITFLEKIIFIVPIIILFAQNRTGINMVYGAITDSILLVFFVISYWKTGTKQA
ncbi:MAG: hypothetical protein KGZ58_07360 [Ignavibacteriales bacterium]|nr:hypothetical protein [Ignavibacteriales bacterium]